MDEQRIRVLHLVDSLARGGTQKAMQLLVCSLDHKRFLPVVCSRQDGPRKKLLQAAGIPLFVGDNAFAALCQFRPHIVHIHRAGWPDRHSLRPLLLYKKQNSLPKIVETNVFGRLDDTAEGHRINLHLFVSRFCLKRYLQDNRIPPDPDRYRVLYNPVQTRFYAEHCPGPAANRHVGRISRSDRGKWSALAWEFAPFVVQRVPDFRYRVVGCIPEAQEAFARHGLQHCLECLPPVLEEGEMAEFFSSVAVLAHANDTGESFGMVIAEAMAAGLPVLTHPCPGNRDNAQLELVEHGVTGLIAPDHQDARAYGQALAWLLQHPEEARAMGRKGREKAQREYDADVLARQLESIYLELLARD